MFYARANLIRFPPISSNRQPPHLHLADAGFSLIDAVKLYCRPGPPHHWWMVHIDTITEGQHAKQKQIIKTTHLSPQRCTYHGAAWATQVLRYKKYGFRILGLTGPLRIRWRYVSSRA